MMSFIIFLDCSVLEEIGKDIWTRNIGEHCVYLFPIFWMLCVSFIVFLFWFFTPKSYIVLILLCVHFYFYYFPVWHCMYTSDDLFVCVFYWYVPLIPNYLVWVNKWTGTSVGIILGHSRSPCSKSTPTTCDYRING